MSAGSIIGGQAFNFDLKKGLNVAGNLTVDGNCDVDGFIYDGGVPVTVPTDDNVWTGKNDFSVSAPTLLAPVNATDGATYDYVNSNSTGAGNGLLTTDNTWSGDNTFSVVPIISDAGTATGDEMMKVSDVDTYNDAKETSFLGSNLNFSGFQDIDQMTVPTPTADLDLANKDYVDNAITDYNNNPLIEIREYTSSSSTLTAAQQDGSKMLVCLVSSGGRAFTGSEANSLYYGGSGQFVAFWMPCLDQDITIRVGDTQGGNDATEIEWGGTTYVSVPNGGENSNGDTPFDADPIVVDASLENGLGDIQKIPSQKSNTRQIDGANNLLGTLPPFVYNGRGIGGVYNTGTSTETLSTAGYACVAIFK